MVNYVDFMRKFTPQHDGQSSPSASYPWLCPCLTLGSDTQHSIGHLAIQASRLANLICLRRSLTIGWNLKSCLGWLILMLTVRIHNVPRVSCQIPLYLFFSIGTVTTQQFLHACESLKEMNMLDFSDEEISRLMKHIRVDDHGNVLYVEFLAGFRLLDKKAPLPPSKNAPILDSVSSLSLHKPSPSHRHTYAHVHDSIFSEL